MNERESDLFDPFGWLQFKGRGAAIGNTSRPELVCSYQESQPLIDHSLVYNCAHQLIGKYFQWATESARLFGIEENVRALNIDDWKLSVYYIIIYSVYLTVYMALCLKMNKTLVSTYKYISFIYIIYHHIILLQHNFTIRIIYDWFFMVKI